MYLQNIVCVAPVLHSQIVRTNIVTNIDTHTQTNKQTNTQGENVITSLTRVIVTLFFKLFRLTRGKIAVLGPLRPQELNFQLWNYHILNNIFVE